MPGDVADRAMPGIPDRTPHAPPFRTSRLDLPFFPAAARPTGASNGAAFAGDGESGVERLKVS